MKLNSTNQLIFRTCLTLLTISVLCSCTSEPIIPTPTPIPLPPTRAQPATTEDSASLFKTGLSYSDAAGDMTVSFLDVVAFKATVNEEAETLDVLLQMSDIPETADRGKVTNLIEYSWTIYVFMNASEAAP